MSTYKELVVWQKAIELVKEVYNICRQLPKPEQFILVSQMIRAAISIPANIAEGWGRNHKVEFIRFLNISYGSSTELETHLIVARNEYSHINYTLAIDLNSEIQKMLTSLVLKMKSSVSKY
ncbi:MAG: four helix bundle protein [Candidatus Doudnabacteria bacterium]|nr:four helix bundle protein [Candidatus Doudnabacteria bacterium]